VPTRYLLSHEEVTELTEAQERAEVANERVYEIQSEERQRLAEELHDSVGQNLVSISLGLARLRMMTPQTESVTTVMGDLSAALREAHAQIRTLSYLLHPPWPDEAGGLEAAVRQFADGFARRAGLRADVRMHGPPCTVDRERELVLFRILQEGLVNVHRHAHANVVLVELHNRGNEVMLQVRDDGCGFPALEGTKASPGVGILGINARVRRFGGQVNIDTGPTGTTLMVRLPTARPSLKPHVNM
jgi:signal transduction histidine kinase